MKILTSDQTHEFLRIYKKSKDEKILERIIEGNISFVYSIINNKFNLDRPKEYLGSGLIGLLRAVQKFKFSKEVKFHTYAAYWVRMMIQRQIISEYSVVRVTPRMVEYSNKRKKGFEFKGICSNREIEKDISMHIESENGYSLEQILVDDRRNPSEEHEYSDLCFKLHERLKWIRYGDILIERYGLDGKGVRKLDEISKEKRLSKERIRQMCVEAIEELRKAVW